MKVKVLLIWGILWTTISLIGSVDAWFSKKTTPSILVSLDSLPSKKQKIKSNKQKDLAKNESRFITEDKIKKYKAMKKSMTNSYEVPLCLTDRDNSRIDKITKKYENYKKESIKKNYKIERQKKEEGNSFSL